MPLVMDPSSMGPLRRQVFLNKWFNFALASRDVHLQRLERVKFNCLYRGRNKLSTSKSLLSNPTDNPTTAADAEAPTTFLLRFALSRSLLLPLSLPASPSSIMALTQIECRRRRPGRKTNILLAVPSSCKHHLLLALTRQRP